MLRTSLSFRCVLELSVRGTRITPPVRKYPSTSPPTWFTECRPRMRHFVIPSTRQVKCPFKVVICWAVRDEAPRITQTTLLHNHAIQDPARDDPRSIPDHVVLDRLEDIRFWALCNVQVPKMLDMLRRDTESLVTRGVLGAPLKRKVRNIVDAMRRSKYASTKDALDFVTDISQDPGAYVKYTVDKNERLEMLFWAYTGQREMALTIGEVLIQDNTAQTNGAKLPFCAFIAVDKENKSRVICQALLPNEQASSYESALTHLIKVCGGLHPKSFNRHWQDILRLTDGTKANDYMRDSVCVNKRKWAFCYRSTALVVGMSATQRVESFFGVLKRVIHGSGSLVMLGQTVRDLCDSRVTRRRSKRTDLERHRWWTATNLSIGILSRSFSRSSRS
ncbi:unnamed protein product [Pylaiella littoralis]